MSRGIINQELVKALKMQKKLKDQIGTLAKASAHTGDDLRKGGGSDSDVVEEKVCRGGGGGYVAAGR